MICTKSIAAIQPAIMTLETPGRVALQHSLIRDQHESDVILVEL
jgi:hypothetical protein